MVMFLSNKKVIIIYSIILLLVAGLTIGSIIYYKSYMMNKYKNISIKKEKKEGFNESLDVKTDYHTNEIIFEDEIKNNDYNLHKYKLTNMKNEEVEEKINEEISKYKYSDISFNANNVLTIELYNNSEEEAIYKTYDLNTGNEISLEDIFVDKIDVAELLAKESYKSVLFNIECTKQGGDGCNLGTISRDLSWYEDYMLMAKNAINKHNYTMIIQSHGIHININDKQLLERIKAEEKVNSSLIRFRINFYKMKDSIALYDRYKSKKSLFNDSKYIDKNAISTLESHAMYTKNGTNSLYYKVNNIVMLDEEYKNEMYKDTYKSEKLNDKYYFFYPSKDFKTIYFDESYYPDTANASYEYSLNKLNYYKFNSLEDIYTKINEYTKEGESFYYPDEYFEKNYINFGTKIYNENKPQKEIKEVSDLFKSDFDYEKEIKEYIQNDCNYKNIECNNIEIKSFDKELKNILVNVDGKEEKVCIAVFPPSKVTIAEIES